ncbi:MAG: hypothetical protein ABIH76_07070 [Candidatus Bathyarchaeota archaeon]
MSTKVETRRTKYVATLAIITLLLIGGIGIFEQYSVGRSSGEGELMVHAIDKTDGSEIEGAWIIIDGPIEGFGTTGNFGYQYFHNVPIGTYHITVGASGYKDRSTDIQAVSEVTMHAFLFLYPKE